MRVLQLDVLVAEERPGGEEGAVEGQRAPEVEGRFFVLRGEGVVVADDAVGFGPEGVDGCGEVGEEGEGRGLVAHVQDVRVDVEGVEAVGGEGQDGVEGGLGGVVVWEG